ncbi:translation initiation factor IF-2 [Candidatus Campbellbacteria bacterium CG11_big_fil_rev_8_21_14_0_20_44_21]|uniref:Translation initiation factor IF-2 n=1 Tax=Candidatus Campbellbacteria bacterium CG22_combo_CG10-13_8_21_14_all_43_18 TaxID=1974530 RepID=A0A2H0DXS0_9BACT|nr:MAG: translation initiation factor IF-2 [Candidatus Campbellbacteria bacterium CG22_combo_CG10-13_8_21_14_all_43_18]PIR24126.1 MAG: translation initiation factor IF-2 [Candidatus Campbellbacteria bacterium CG11_big_fil_rev_8_21_14_0_20_44_21]
MSEIERAPVIVVMGHIDHGKSRFLDYVRKSNVVAKEAGGITQHISAYQAKVELKDGREKKITFLDTPGHAAFSKMRTRGCNMADIAILMVSAEEGVKAQTLEALKSVRECKIPFIVAINKIDKPGANLEATKNSLLQNEVYLEGLGGDIPYLPISAETGEGVQELLETIILMAELEELKGDEKKPAEGFILEANMDSKRGVSASLVIKNGYLKLGMFVVQSSSFAPVRIMEDFLGKPIKEARFSDPVKITGWNKLPEVGKAFQTYKNKKEAMAAMEENKSSKKEKTTDDNISLAELSDKGYEIIPVIIKADTKGSVEAITEEVQKIDVEKVFVRIIKAKTGNITENDIKTAGSIQNTIVLGFNTKEERGVKTLALRLGVEIKIFDIIYKLTEWLDEEVKKRKPKIKTEEIGGKARVLKIFSRVKDKQVLGGEVFEGKISKGDKVKIWRRGEEIGIGNIVELQSGKMPAPSINEGSQFGAKINSAVEIAERDNIESVKIVEK